jgi:hypothetical protein
MAGIVAGQAFKLQATDQWKSHNIPQVCSRAEAGALLW